MPALQPASQSKPRDWRAGYFMKPLDPKTVARIIRLGTTSNMTQEAIAAECDVHQSTVSKVLRTFAVESGKALDGKAISRRYRSKPVRPNMIRLLEQQWRIQHHVCVRSECRFLAARGLYCHTHSTRTLAHISDIEMAPGLRAAWEAYRETILTSVSPRKPPIETPGPRRRAR